MACLLETLWSQGLSSHGGRQSKALRPKPIPPEKWPFHLASSHDNFLGKSRGTWCPICRFLFEDHPSHLTNWNPEEDNSSAPGVLSHRSLFSDTLKAKFPCAPLPTYRPLKFFHIGNQYFNPFPYSTAMSWHLSTFRTFFCSLLLFSLPNVGFLWSHLPLFCIWSRQMPSFPLFGLPIPSASAGPPGLPCLKNLPHCKIIPTSSDWICDYWSVFTLGMKSCCTFPGYHLYCISIHKYTHVPVLLLCDQSRVEFYTSPPSSS